MIGRMSPLQSTTMLKLARLLLLIALALTVPAQAMSAVMAGICMANDHHAGAAHSHDTDDPHPHQYDGPNSAHEHDGDSGHASNAHCAPCVACCAAAAISSAESNLLPELPAAGPFAVAPNSAVGFQPDGLDRPPLAL